MDMGVPTSVRVSLPTTTLNNQQRWARFLAMAAIVVYVPSQLLLNYSLIPSSITMLADRNALAILEAFSLSASLTSIILEYRSYLRIQKALLIVALPVLLVSEVLTSDSRLFIGYIVLIATANIDIRNVAKAYYSVAASSTLLIVALSIIGMIPNADSIPNSRIVYCYGFTDPNVFAAVLFSISAACAIAASCQRSRRLAFFLALFFSAFSYVSLSSNTCAVATLAIALLLLFNKIMTLSRRRWAPGGLAIRMMVLMPVVLMVAMLYLTAFYDADNALHAYLNAGIHGRPFFSHEYYLEHDGFSWFGRPMVFESAYHNGLSFSNVDCGYSRASLTYGILSLCILLATYIVSVLMMRRYEEEGHVLRYGLLVIAALYLVTEKLVLWLPLSFPAFLIAYAFRTQNCLDDEAG